MGIAPPFLLSAPNNALHAAYFLTTLCVSKTLPLILSHSSSPPHILSPRAALAPRTMPRVQLTSSAHLSAPPSAPAAILSCQPPLQHAGSLSHALSPPSRISSVAPTSDPSIKRKYCDFEDACFASTFRLSNFLRTFREAAAPNVIDPKIILP
jgi:hypothetical protein